MNLTKEKYNKCTESDQQMLVRISKKFVVLFFVILMFDVLIDIFLGVFDLFIESIHLIIEFIEYSIEVLLEHILNSNHHESEVIIVNASILIAIYLIYRFFLTLPRTYSWALQKSKEHWHEHQRCESAYWQALPLSRKIKIGMVYSIGFLFIFSLVTI